MPLGARRSQYSAAESRRTLRMRSAPDKSDRVNPKSCIHVQSPDLVRMGRRVEVGVNKLNRLIDPFGGKDTAGETN